MAEALSRVTPNKNVSVYIDGFNLYHAVTELKDNRLKWLNLMSLSKSFLRPQESIGQVYFFTAVVTWNKDKEQRHRNFMRAQEASGVTLVESKFKKARRWCEETSRFCKRHEEKQTDVAFATTLMADAIESKMSRAILITADTDHVPLVRHISRLFPHLSLTLATPPRGLDHARELGALIPDRMRLEPSRMLAHQLPRSVTNANGKVVAEWPAYYDESSAGMRMEGAPDAAGDQDICG